MYVQKVGNQVQCVDLIDASCNVKITHNNSGGLEIYDAGDYVRQFAITLQKYCRNTEARMTLQRWAQGMSDNKEMPEVANEMMADLEELPGMHTLMTQSNQKGAQAWVGEALDAYEKLDVPRLCAITAEHRAQSLQDLPLFDDMYDDNIASCNYEGDNNVVSYEKSLDEMHRAQSHPLSYHAVVCIVDGKPEMAIEVNTIIDMLRIDYIYSCGGESVLVKQCPMCGTIYQPKMRNQVYCCAKCKADNKKRIEEENPIRKYAKFYRTQYQEASAAICGIDDPEIRKMYDSYRTQTKAVYDTEKKKSDAWDVYNRYYPAGSITDIVINKPEPPEDIMPFNEYRNSIHHLWEEFYHNLKALKIR